MSLLEELFGKKERPDQVYAERQAAGFKDVRKGKTFSKSTEKVYKKQKSRSKRAKTIDELFNAPIAKSIKEWLKSPNRYDLPHIDTVSQKVKKRREQRALKKVRERGDVEEVKEVEREELGKKNWIAEFSGEKKEIHLTESRKKGRTLAHEVGHAIDWATGKSRGHGLTSRFMGKEEKYRGVPLEDLKQLRGIGSRTIEKLKKKGCRDVQDVYEASKVDRLPRYIETGRKQKRVNTNVPLYHSIYSKIDTNEERKQQLQGELKEAMEWLDRGLRRSGEWKSKYTEKTAEFIRSAITQPRATKRRFPRLWKVAKEAGVLKKLGVKWR